MVKLEPHTAVWEFTLKCDSNCIHCGSSAKKPRKDELNTKECLSLVEQLDEAEFRRVILSGGEPTLREDWMEVAQRIKERGLSWGIISNALNWDKRVYECFSSFQPFAVGFSVDGEREIHDYFRGVVGSHQKVFDAVKKLKKVNQLVSIVTSVNKLNLNELKKIRNRVLVYEIDAWQIQVASPMGRMREHQDIVLDDKEYRQLAEFIAETREAMPHVVVKAADCIGYFGKLESRLRDFEWDGCSAGIRAIGIDSNGGIRGCLSIQGSRFIEGNIRDTSLREIWENPNNFSYNRKFRKEDLGDKCAGCDYGEKCKGGCQCSSVSFFSEFHNAPYCLYRSERE